MKNNLLKTKIFLMLIIICISITSCIGSGINSRIDSLNANNNGTKLFPTLTATNLFGENLDLPTAFTGEVNLVILAFKREQQADVDTWIKALPKIQSNIPNLNFYELPILSEGSALFRFTVNNGMRSGIPDPDARKRTITVYTNKEEFIKELGISNMESIVALLINKNGEIISADKGVYSEEKTVRMKANVVVD